MAHVDFFAVPASAPYVLLDEIHLGKSSQQVFGRFSILGCAQSISTVYTWQIYSQRLLTFTGVYGLSKHVSNLDHLESRRYLEMFYALKYRPLAQTVPLSQEE